MADPFVTLGVPPRFDLLPNDLRARLLRKTAEHHPDRFPDPDQQAEAQGQMSRVNAAFAELSDPLTRAHALIARLTGQPADPSSTPKPPANLLMQVLDVRESIDEARDAGDDKELARQKAWVQGELDRRLAEVASAFATLTPDGDAHPARLPANHPTLEAIRADLSAARYLQRMLEAIQRPDGATAL
ncbi:MAG: iron-sulfur cluster co-chaperone HscB C-terminal domain-containing protein [Planctomycetota bacterium]